MYRDNIMLDEFQPNQEFIINQSQFSIDNQNINN